MLVQSACGQLKLYFNTILNATITFYNIYSVRVKNALSVKLLYSTRWCCVERLFMSLI